jgi:hypothetical protein
MIRSPKPDSRGSAIYIRPPARRTGHSGSFRYNPETTPRITVPHSLMTVYFIFSKSVKDEINRDELSSKVCGAVPRSTTKIQSDPC